MGNCSPTGTCRALRQGRQSAPNFACADAALSKPERADRRLLALIREQYWERFPLREVLRLDRQGLATAAEPNPAVTALEEAEVICSIVADPGPRGGRPTGLFTVNPAV